jgi:protein TonB
MPARVFERLAAPKVPPTRDVYSPHEIARAAGVPHVEVIEILGAADVFVGYADAVHLGRTLLRSTAWTATTASAGPLDREDHELFRTVINGAHGAHAGRGISLVVSSSVHVLVIAAALLVTAFGVVPTATSTFSRADTPRMVFLTIPGPGGGGGGGGRRQPEPPRTAGRPGRRLASNTVQVRPSPAPLPVERPKPPLEAESLPAVVAPIVSVPTGEADRAGDIAAARVPASTHGPGTNGGAGTGSGSGVGEGVGPGLGAGSGGGTGGGPYRPGSGIEAPRLLHEVKAEYTEEARRRGIEGDVVLEIVVRHDGSVGAVRVVEALQSGLDRQAAQAVRQWRFAPATRLGVAVDVLVEVAVEFKLR